VTFSILLVIIVFAEIATAALVFARASGRVATIARRIAMRLVG
jgi:hypothetical protein